MACYHWSLSNPKNIWLTLHFRPRSSTPMKMVSYTFPRLKEKAVWWHWDTKVGCAETALHINSERETLQCGVSQADSDAQAFLGRLRSPSPGWQAGKHWTGRASLPFFPKRGGAGDRPGWHCGLGCWSMYWNSHSAPECPLIYSDVLTSSLWNFHWSFARKINNIVSLIYFMKIKSSYFCQNWRQS